MQFTSNVDQLNFEHRSQAYISVAAVRRWDSVINRRAKSLMHQTGVQTFNIKKKRRVAQRRIQTDVTLDYKNYLIKCRIADFFVILLNTFNIHNR